MVSGHELKAFKNHVGERIWKKVFGNVEGASQRCYHSKGCKACNGTGYQGRLGIFEVLEMDEAVKELIMNKANADKIQEQAVINGMITMMEDGVKKVLNGTTTVEELMRVTRS